MHPTLIRIDRGSIAIKPLMCRAWTCDECAPIRRRWLRARLIRGNPNTFLTITIRRRSGETPDAAASRLRAAWARMRRWIEQEAARDPTRRTTPYGAYAPLTRADHHNDDSARRAVLTEQRLAYAAIWERTQSGWPHLHILLRVQWLDQAWLSACMQALIDSPIVFIERVRSATRAARYVSKYISKSPARFHGTKRYWFSRRYEPPSTYTPPPDPLPDAIQYKSNRPWHTIAARLSTWGAVLSGVVRRWHIYDADPDTLADIATGDTLSAATPAPS